MKVEAIRQAFIDFFAAKDHTTVPSSSLIPVGDDSLLFTNAGMVQFKDNFLGKNTLEYVRAVSSQRCVRAGGKHNDLENVGYTTRHHTFFEMLGNFSFGDYFKREAIQFAWSFLTETLKLPPEKLWITVYQDDDEAAKIWLDEMNVSKERFSRLGEKDNFWSMGDTGPCGPCSEIFYDHGADVFGSPPGTKDEDGDRYVEIWNLVFMQFDRSKDGKLSPLPKPSVDTGMGLERIAAVMQGVKSNYDIDLFKNLISEVKRLTNTDKDTPSLKVIADHIRACCFLITDGVLPSNEGRGYVLRRIIRRALRHGHQLGFELPFFYQLVPSLAKLMGGAYPELHEKQTHLESTIKREEQQFAKTLEQGLKILEQSIQVDQKVLDGELAFRLYDTYGFPIDLTCDILRERNMSVDMAGFEKAMNAQKERARSASQFGANALEIELPYSSEFIGYQEVHGDSKILALIQDNQEVETLSSVGAIVLESTPFYAESGGQIGDQGVIESETACFEVIDTQKIGNAIVHFGDFKQGSFKKGDKTRALINQSRRQEIKAHHSVTHLLHAVLRDQFGTDLAQKGSLVEAQRLRFDFTLNRAITPEELTHIESRVNQLIWENTEAQTEVLSIAEAKAKGAVALFGEKYGDTVRVLSLANGFSVELCGGTHVKRTGDIGLFKITNESGIAQGVRRIEALANRAAFEHLRNQETLLLDSASALKVEPSALAQKLDVLRKQVKQLEKENQALEKRAASGAGGQSLLDEAQTVNGVKVLAKTLTGGNPGTLRELVDDLKNQIGSGIIVLGVASSGKVSIITGVTKDLTGRFNAKELVNYVAVQVGGKGGGRPDMAQAGGSDPSKLENAILSVIDWVNERPD